MRTERQPRSRVQATQYIQAAKALCSQFKLGACIDQIEKAIKSDPTHPAIPTLLTVAGKLQVELCSNQPAYTPIERLRRMSCIDSEPTLRRSATFNALARKQAEALAEALDDHAQRVATGAPAGAIVLQSMAQCFAPSEQRNTRVRQFRANFLRYSSISLGLRFTSSGLSIDEGAICDAAVKSHAPAVTCGIEIGSGPTPIDLHWEIIASKVIHSTTAKKHIATYWDGEAAKEVKVWKKLETIMNTAERKYRVIESEAEQYIAACEQRRAEFRGRVYRNGTCTNCAKERAIKRACSRAKTWMARSDAAKSVWTKAAGEWDYNTPEHTSANIKYRYENERHTWTTKFTIRLYDRNKRVIVDNRAFSYSDNMRNGFEPAGVTTDRLIPPPDDFWSKKINRYLIKTLDGYIGKVLEKRRGAAPISCARAVERWNPRTIERWAQREFLHGHLPSLRRLIDCARKEQPSLRWKPICRPEQSAHANPAVSRPQPHADATPKQLEGGKDPL